MKPFYKRNEITIYCGDCLKVMPQLNCTPDVVLTDPPYGISGSSGTINTMRAKGKYIQTFDDTPLYIQKTVIKAIEMCVEICNCVVITPGNKNFMLYPQPDSFGCFYQPASIGLQTFGNADAQPIFYYGKNAQKRNMGIPCSYQLTESPPKNGHPCPKPIKAWTKLLANISLERHLILDPFMGSGTTLVAAQNLNCHAIGIDISEEYCKIAVERLRQPSFWSLPAVSKPKGEQMKLRLDK